MAFGRKKSEADELADLGISEEEIDKAIEYSPDELKKREADDLRYFLSKNEKLRADINREVKAETDKGRTLEEATKHAISQCIEKLGMYLSADIYMDDDDYE